MQKTLTTFRKRGWLVALGVGIIAYLALTLTYLFLGRLNADEAWYLYASTMVFDLQIPYRDFAFTQTPLLPYLYGLPQALLGPSLYLGRVTTVAVSLLNLGFAVALAWRVQGKAAAGLTALLFGSFTFGIYFNTIVKTYALVALFLTLTLFTLSTRLPETVKFPLAIALAGCAALVRLAAGPFLGVIAVYALLAARRRPVKALAAVTIVAGIAAGAWLLFSESAEIVRWNLLTHHLNHWRNRSLEERLTLTRSERLPELFRTFELYIALAFFLLVAFLSRRSLRRQAGEWSSLLAGAAGLSLFALAHFLTGGWHMEYFVPATIAFFPLFAIFSVRLYRDDSVSRPTRGLLAVLFLAIFTVYPVEGFTNERYIDLSGGELPVAEVQEVASYVAEHSAPSDRIMTLEGLWVVLEAKRDALPGMTMAQFSYEEEEGEMVERLNLVNAERIVAYLVTQAPEVVVLTEHDWQRFGWEGTAEQIESALLEHYDLTLMEDNFGQRSERVFVYLPRDRTAGRGNEHANTAEKSDEVEAEEHN